MPKHVQLPAVLGAGVVPTQSILWNCVSDLFSNAMKPEVGFAGAVALVNPVIAGPVIGLAVLCGVGRYMSRRRSEAEDRALHEQIKQFAGYAAEGRDVLADIADGTIALNVEVDDLVKMDIAEFVDRQLGGSESELRRGLSEEFERVLSLHPKIEEIGGGVELLQVLAWTADARGRRMESLLQQVHAILLRERAETAESVTSERSEEDSVTLESALRSRDPATRRVALLVNRELKKARATHELAKSQHADRPSDDARVRARDAFLDTIFEADLLRAEGRLEDAVPLYAKACELEPEDVHAAVALVEANTDYIYWQGPEMPRPPAESVDAAMAWRDQAQKSLELLVETVLHTDHDAGSSLLLPAAWALARFAYESYVHLGDRVEHYSHYKDKSLQALEKAEEGSPDHPVTLRLLGRHWWRLEGDAAQANQYFARAVEQEPNTVGTRLYYALSLLEQGRNSEATEAFEASLDIDPDDPNVLGAYGDFLARDPATETQAERMWRHAVSVWPEHRSVWYSLIRFLASKPERIEDTEAAFVAAIEARPGDVSLLVGYADFLTKQPGRESDAHDVNIRIRDLRPTSTDTLLRLLLGALACGKVSGDARVTGIHLYNDGVKKQELLLMLGGAWIGLLYGGSENHAEALRAIKQIVEYASTPPEFSYLNNRACLRQVVAAGHSYSEWLEPLALVLAGEQTFEALSDWEIWQELPSG